MLSRKASMLAAAIVGAALSAPAAMASTVTFFQFQGDPDLLASPKEFVYDAATGLHAGPGAVGDHTQMSIASPGLLGTITGGLPGIPASPPGIGPGPNYYILSDLTLVLTGFTPVGNADISVPGKITQDLSGGSFALIYPGFSKPILAGTVTGALITEKKATPGPGPGDNASVLSGTVTYTDSVLEDNFAAAHLGHTGTFSFALTGMTGNYGTVLVGTEHHLAGFSADGTGSFDATPLAVPTPAAVWGGFGLVGLLGAARVKKRRDMSA